MLAGVFQGSTLTPMLHNLYTSYIPMSISAELAVYADGICISDKSRIPGFEHLAVKRHLEEVGSLATKWGYPSTWRRRNI